MVAWELAKHIVARYPGQAVAMSQSAGVHAFPWLKAKMCDLHPSLVSLGDGLLGSVGSQRAEAKRQAFCPAQDLNPGPQPGRPMVNS